MKCESVVFSGHAVRRMFERSVTQSAVVAVVATGDIVTEYPEDSPYPSRLLFGYADGRPLHVVVAHDISSGLCIVITVYEPTVGQWGPDFKTRGTQ